MQFDQLAPGPIVSSPYDPNDHIGNQYNILVQQKLVELGLMDKPVKLPKVIRKEMLTTKQAITELGIL